jgi:hypothetical protein
MEAILKNKHNLNSRLHRAKGTDMATVFAQGMRQKSKADCIPS